MPPSGAKARQRRLPRAPPSATLRVLDDLRRQLFRLRAFATLTYPFACVPFLFLYFRRHGMSEAQYGEIVGAYYVAMFLAEVPTGMLADRIGPKAMMVAGPLLLAGGFLSLLAWPEYPGFVLAEVLLGFAHAVLSGPPATLLYETLQRAGQAHRFLREESRLSALRMLGTGAAFLLGGALARWSVPTQDGWEPTIIATAGLCAAAAVLAATLHGGPPRAQLRLPAFLRGVAHEVRRPAVLWLLGYWVVLFALLRFPFHDYLPYLEAAAAQEPLLGQAWLLGLLFAALNLFAAPLSASLPGLVARYGRRPLFWAMPLALCASLLVMAGERGLADAGAGSRWLAWLGVAMFFVQQVPFGLHQSLLYEFVNHRLGNDVRTTVLSLLSLGARLCYAVINVLLFTFQDRHGIPAALLLVGGGGAVATVLVMLLRPRGLLRGRDRLEL
jgi:predicted MFS family arabinose efflux permease